MTQPFGYGYNNYPPLYGPSLPFYWQQPFYSAAQQTPPRYVCKKDEEDEEKLVCEVDPETIQQPQLFRQPVMYIRPFSGNWFF